MGLAALYQIRGRVGRSDRQAYAYITYRRDKMLSEEADKRLEFYKWLEELEYNLLELPKPDLTILLHVPYQKVLELKRGRNITDGYESSFLHLKNTENTYLELAKLHNYEVIECVKKGSLRDIFDIHEEIKKIIKEIGE